MSEPRTLDLHGVVPDPPDDLLGVDGIYRRVRRDRIVRTVAAVAAVAIVVAASVIAASKIGDHKTTPAGTGPHTNGDIYYVKDRLGAAVGLPYSTLYRSSTHGEPASVVINGTGRIEAVAGSPDGHRIAFVEAAYSTGSHPRVTAVAVHIANADGSDDRAVYNCLVQTCSQILWSPDSQRLLIIDQSPHVMEPGGSVQPLCGSACPVRDITTASWSPDGKKLAFVYKGSNRFVGDPAAMSSIATVYADGSHLKQLTSVHCDTSSSICTQDESPVWSPDGSHIAFIRVTTNPNNQIENKPVFERQSLDIVSPDGGAVTTPFHCGGNCAISDLSWTPDGNKLAAAVTHDKITTPGHYVYAGDQLVFVTFSGSRPPVVDPQTDAGLLANALTWSPDGRWLVVIARARDGSISLYLAQSANGGVTPPVNVLRAVSTPVAWLPAAR